MQSVKQQTKFAAAAGVLRERIETGVYSNGAPMPAEAELAREFGINRRTLRRALDVLESERLVIRRQGRGTFVQSPPQDEHLATLIYAGDTEQHYASTFYQALCAEAQDRGKVVSALKADSPDKIELLAELARRNPRLICMEENWQKIKHAIPEDVRVTRVSDFYGIDALSDTDRPGYVVSTDSYRAAGLAVDYLIRLGHRRIAYVDWAPARGGRLGTITLNRPSYYGYRSALFRAHIARDYPVGITDAPGGDYQEHFFQAMLEYLSDADELPTAFVCAADFRAGPVIRALRETGHRVPEDASVVGIGNTPWAQWLDTPLTSVCLGEAQMARIALLLNEDTAPLGARLVHIAPHLVERCSSGPAPRGKD